MKTMTHAIDPLVHTIKSVNTSIAMAGSSNRAHADRSYADRSYGGNSEYQGGAYESHRYVSPEYGESGKRDSMGRFTRDYDMR